MPSPKIQKDKLGPFLTHDTSTVRPAQGKTNFPIGDTVKIRRLGVSCTILVLITDSTGMEEVWFAQDDKKSHPLPAKHCDILLANSILKVRKDIAEVYARVKNRK